MDRKIKFHELLLANLNHISSQLIEYGVLKIILFGSVGNENTSSRSDLELLCVMPNDKSGKEWRKLIDSNLDYSVNCDLLFFNQV